MTKIRFLQQMIALGFRVTMAPTIVRETIQRRKVTILAYHRISAPLFEKHVRYLARRYSIISLDTFVKAKRSANIAALPVKPLVITFDDGAKDNHSLREILLRHKVPATFFVCSEIVGSTRQFWFNHMEKAKTNLKTIADVERLRRLSEIGFDERRECNTREALSEADVLDLLSAGASIQSHTLTHPILPMCDDSKAEAEIARSRLALEDRFGIKVNSLAYPNGDYTQRDMGICEKSGYLAALTMEWGFNDNTTDIFRLKRMSIGDHAGINELSAKATGVWGFAKRIFDILRGYRRGWR